MIFRNFNDFEIINLIKQGNEEAFQLMVDKYKFFVAKMIKKFNLQEQYDDMFQEALMILYKSIMRFDQSFNKTFMRYFEMNLTNRFITIKNKHNRYGKFLSEKLPTLYQETIHETKHYYISDTEIRKALDTLSDLEKQVFQLKIIEKRSIQETADYLEFSQKKIYNALDRIKKKIKIHLM
jgi:RNA polymerase sporulation-specific sigma factor